MIDVNRVKELLSAACPYDPEEIELNSDLIEDLELDSFGLLDMVISFEKEYDISIPDRDLRLFSTVNDIIEYLEEKTK